jgi:hypothetical protein
VAGGARTRAGHAAALGICVLLGGLGVLQLFGNGGVIAWLLVGFLALGARFLLRPRAGELRLVALCAGGLVLLVALLVAGLFAAWESAEVVVLRYTGADGHPTQARLWVIDLDGSPCVASGSENRRVELIRAHPEVELVRGGRAECRRAVVMPASAGTEEARAKGKRLYEEKYGFRIQGSRLLRFVFGAPPGEEPALIRLEPCSPTPS